jgi:hypothetical protein
LLSWKESSIVIVSFLLTLRRKDPTLSETGEVWYKILGYVDTVEEAQMFLYGRVYN